MQSRKRSQAVELNAHGGDVDVDGTVPQEPEAQVLQFPCRFENKRRFWTATRRQKLVEHVSAQQLALRGSTQLRTDEDDADINIDWHSVATDLLQSDQVKSSTGMHITAVDCYLQFVNVDDPRLNKSADWSHEEDLQLMKLVAATSGYDWDWIASQLGTHRSPIQCLRHYQQSLSVSTVSSLPWTQEEDSLLRQSVALYGWSNWAHVANSVGRQRTAVQCHHRARLVIAQDASVGEWNDQDDKRLFLAAVALGAPSAMNSSSSSRVVDVQRANANFIETVVDGMDDNEAGTVRNKDSDSDSDAEDKIALQRSRSKFSWAMLARLVPGKYEAAPS
jgi:hypothetical protein